MRLIGFVLSMLSPACLWTPQRPAETHSDAATDGTTDGLASDTPPSGSLCVGGKTAVLFDDFNAAPATNPPCGGNGVIFKSGTGSVARSGGKLQFIATTAGVGAAYCNWNPFPSRDLVVKLVDIPVASFNAASDVDVAPPNASGTTFLQVVGGAPADLKLLQDSTELKRIDWQPNMLWWRYRILGAQQVAADYSADGATWTQLETATWATGATSLMELTVGVTVSDPTGGSFTVDEIYTCQ